MNAAPTNPLDAAVVRAGAAPDHRRVFGDWLNSYATSAWAKSLTPPEQWKRSVAARAYWDGHHEIIERLLVRAELVVCCWPEDAQSILGWALLEPSARVLHYVYVTKAYRRARVARRLVEVLLDGRPVTYSHRSRVCGELPIPANWRFDPYAAFLT